ncbi:HD domain-containing protein [Sulfitobacter albidus]|uniref:HD domain-containing protein n=1 Tax=Sulfitobacter albidus TaxID=2829501 RepID=A0A975JG97_9RHOB|nr:HD domain-containing protein [Sulfitobacter albidus]QUJ77757.1 HD domain-containing protein [Sulfitobacter albidus]
MTARLDAQIAFLNEADRLKSIVRATTLTDGSRYENSAEHSWHLTLYALVLADQAGPDVDITRVIQMLILHDLVEIDAGDTPIFDEVDAAAVARAEAAAATRIFGLLPEDQGPALRAIWEEFEAAQTPDAQFAKSLDRFQPPMQNLASGGGSWTDYNVSEDRIAARVGAKIAIGAPRLWDYARARIAAFFANIPKG